MTIICAKEAGIPIKCYSPELIVYPVIELGEEEWPFLSSFMSSADASVVNALCEKNERRIKAILSRIDSLVIGPGAGRNPVMLSTMQRIIQYAIESKIPLVIDGDGLWAVTQEPQLIHQLAWNRLITCSAKNVILTPNQMEFTRLWNAVMKEKKTPAELTTSSSYCSFVKTLAAKSIFLPSLKCRIGVTILQKGAVDQISNGVFCSANNNKGSPRRCGGQGDVVAGVMGVMHLWCSRAKDIEFDPLCSACALTSFIVREASRRAFKKERRGMTALSVASELSSLIDEDELRVC